MFPPHIFDGYKLRVNDTITFQRIVQNLAEILAHSLDEAELPKIITRDLSINVLIDIHNPPIEISEKESFGFYYIPARRDSLNSESGRIVAVTILHAEEAIISKRLLTPEIKR